MSAGRSILFTAFEPSGDEHAAPVIAQLRRMAPEVTIYALGGRGMEEAGAHLIEETTQHAAMLVGGAVSQARRHRQRLGRLRKWLAEHEIAALVPVDSPAANWSICKAVRKQRAGAKIVHLVAPQLWAWGEWRIRKLRRLTDHVLCLLPFEPEWFGSRGVKATFVGHPVYDPELGVVAWAPALRHPPEGRPKLALLPGSRRGEIRANWPVMFDLYTRLKREHPELTAVVAAKDEPLSEMIHREIDRRVGTHAAKGLEVRVNQTQSVLAWCDVALVVSGTATLHVAAHRKPMVVMFRVNRVGWNLVGRWVVNTRTFALPNLLVKGEDGGRVVPEFVPHFGKADAVEEQVERLMTDEGARLGQIAALERVAGLFAGKSYASEAAGQVLRMVNGSNP